MSNMLRLDPSQYEEIRKRQRGERGKDITPRGVKETTIQNAIIEVLTFHPAVAFVVRMNTGGMTQKHNGRERFIKFGFKGMSDILGMTKTGRFIAIEVKRPGKKPTDDQQAFLDKVGHHGGIAFCATSIDEAVERISIAQS